MRAMWTARTVSSAGILLFLASCSSSADNPKGSNGAEGGSGVGTGAGPSSGATGAASAGNGTGDTGGGSGEVGGGSSEVGGGSNTGGGSGVTGGASSTGGVNTSTGGAGGACANQTSETTAVPPILQFVIDVTGSMSSDAYPNDPNNNATKLAELKRILPPVFAGFPSDWAVGVQFYNYAQGGGCYVGRQAVSIAALSTNLVAINAAIAGVNALNWTPTYAAWAYGLGQVRAFSDPVYAKSPRSIVLITDGVPTVTNDGCTIQNPISQAEYDALINQVQANGMGGTPPIKTYVIGVLGSQDPQGATYDPMYQLSLLAIAGGTGVSGCTPTSGVPGTTDVSPRGTYCHYDLTSNPDFATGLQNALAAIGGGQISCTYTVPPPPSDGRVFDLKNITLTYIPSSGISRVLGQAANASCAGGQWYVSQTDAGGNPTELQLCPDTCAAASGDPGAQIEVTFVCLKIQ
jgi:hypothetical protein